MGVGRFSESRAPASKPPIDLVFEEFYPEVEIPDYGIWKKILCPLHVEERPSASINIEENRWKCHACDISEDSIDVIQREEGIGFREAQEWANARFGGGGEALPEPVQREPSRGVSNRPRFGGGGRKVAPRVRRRFGGSGS